MESPKITLYNNLVFTVENNGDGMVLTIGDEIDIVENIQIESILTMIERFIFTHSEFFKGTDPYVTVLRNYIEKKT